MSKSQHLPSTAFPPRAHTRHDPHRRAHAQRPRRRPSSSTWSPSPPLTPRTVFRALSGRCLSIPCAAPAAPVAHGARPSLRLLPHHEQLLRRSKALPAVHHQHDAHHQRSRTNSDLHHGGGGFFPSPTPPPPPLRARRPPSAQSRSHHLTRPPGLIPSTTYTTIVVPNHQ